MGEEQFNLEQRSFCSFTSHVTNELGAVVHGDLALELHLASLVTNGAELGKPLLENAHRITVLSPEGVKLSSLSDFDDIAEVKGAVVVLSATASNAFGFNSEGTLNYTIEFEDASKKRGSIPILVSTDRKNGMFSQFYYRECLELPATIIMPGFSGDVEIPVIKLENLLISELFTFERSGNSERISELADSLRSSWKTRDFDRKDFESTMEAELKSASKDINRGKIRDKYREFLAFLDGKKDRFSTMPPPPKKLSRAVR